jgi:hypothetical protein
VVDTWAALTQPRPHRPALSERDAMAVLRQEAGLGRLPTKLVDALESLVLSTRPGKPPVPGRFEEGAGGARPGGEPDEQEDPSSRMERRLTVVAARPAGGLALSL